VAFARQCAYYNSYGPTETTVCSTLYRVDPAVAYGSRIPIGTAIANTGVLLLDEQLRSVADGVPGELCVSGVSLAVGYLHQDELTARQFPSYDVDGGRIYRTGDLAVRRPDGQLELLGRRDNQVKIRGYRIELGEIEAVLSQVDGVRDVAVLAQDEPSGRRLVAYTTGAVDEAALRDAIARRLPTFMMPSAFHVLAEMPTTANGKIDRKQLPSLVETTIADDSADQELTPVQAVLVRIWREVLQRPVGLHDDFFALGGDSILVIQVASRARAEGVRITPAQLFEHPTVAALSTVAVLSARALDDGGPAQGMAPLGPMQHWFFEQESAAPHHFNQTLLLEAPQGLDVSAVRSAVAAVVEKHDALRLAFTRAKDGWQAAYMPAPADAPLSVVDLSSLAPAERMARLLADGAARQDGFVLEAPPLLQAVAYVAGAGEPAWLLLLAHHLVVDGVSWRILLDDLQESYVAALRGQSHALRSRTTSYGAWIARLQEEVPQFEAELPYWVDVVSYPTPALPRDLDPPGTPRVASVVRSACGGRPTTPGRCSTRRHRSGRRFPTCCSPHSGRRSRHGPVRTRCRSHSSAMDVSTSTTMWICRRRWAGAPVNSRSVCPSRRRRGPSTRYVRCRTRCARCRTWAWATASCVHLPMTRRVHCCGWPRCRRSPSTTSDRRPHVTWMAFRGIPCARA